MLRLLVVEDHALVREGLTQSLTALDTEVAVVGVSDAEQALEVLAGDAGFDLALLDLMLPGTSGLAFLGVLRKRFPQLPVVIVSALDDPETVARALAQGAVGFVPKSSPGQVLLEGLRQVLEGGVFVPEHLQGAATASRRRGTQQRFGLTDSQMRVLHLAAQGKTNREIGELLDLAEGTIKIHMSAIFKAMKVTNRSQALLALHKPVSRV